MKAWAFLNWWGRARVALQVYAYGSVYLLQPDWGLRSTSISDTTYTVALES